MSHRASHRILAQELRLDRIAARRPADPSRRGSTPRQTYSCPLCHNQFWQGFQLRLHVLLKACQR